MAGSVSCAERSEHVTLVGERLPHAHEHDVGQPLRCGRRQLRGLPPSPDCLGADLAGAEVVLQPHLPGGAERAAHRAARLRRDAHRHPVRVPHQYGLDDVRPAEPKQRLAGGTAVGCSLGQDLDTERQLSRQTFTERPGDVGHVLVGNRAFPELAPDLLRPECGLTPADKAVGELIQGEVVGAWHRAQRSFSHPRTGARALRRRSACEARCRTPSTGQPSAGPGPHRPRSGRTGARARRDPAR